MDVNWQRTRDRGNERERETERQRKRERERDGEKFIIKKHYIHSSTQWTLI